MHRNSLTVALRLRQVGPGLHESTQMGQLVSEEQLNTVSRFLAQGKMVRFNNGIFLCCALLYPLSLLCVALEPIMCSSMWARHDDMCSFTEGSAASACVSSGCTPSHRARSATPSHVFRCCLTSGRVYVTCLHIALVRPAPLCIPVGRCLHRCWWRARWKPRLLRATVCHQRRSSRYYY